MPYKLSKYTVAVEPFRTITVESDCPFKAARKVSIKGKMSPGDAIKVYSEKNQRWMMYEVGATPRVVRGRGSTPLLSMKLE